VYPWLVQHGGERQRIRCGGELIGNGAERGPGTGPASGKPAVGQRFLDDDRASGLPGLGERRAGGGLEQVPGDLLAAEQRGPVDGDGGADRLTLLGAAGGQADRDTLAAEPGQATVQDRVGEHRALRRNRVDLVDVEVATEQAARLGQLTDRRSRRCGP